MTAFVGLLHVTLAEGFAAVTLHCKTALPPSVTVIAGDTLIFGLTAKLKCDIIPRQKFKLKRNLISASGARLQ